MLPGTAFGLLRKRTCPTTEFDGGGVVLPFRVKKAMSSPEPTTAATSKAIKTMYKVLRFLAGCAMTLGVVARVCLSFADGVNVEGDEVIGGGENWNDDGVKGVGVIPGGREGCCEL